ncbi:hypothetical protein OG21DRAFT_648776 [Imleria badia]|nr:hypothetical protein OG21DRAFT_648776 [Imleria badia]
MAVSDPSRNTTSCQSTSAPLSLFLMASSTALSDILQIKALSLDEDVHFIYPLSNPYNIPESARDFFTSVSSPSEILSSKFVSRLQGTDVIEGGYNFRFPINLDTISRSQTRTSVGCMLYCQRHPELNIPTPAIYAYSCTYGSEFIAMEYINGDSLSDVWLDLTEEEKENMANQVARIMRTMRTKTSFNVIGGISPDGSGCPLVDGVDVASGRGIVDSLGLYNTGPYESVQEYVRSVFDRQFHYMDQMLHENTLSAHEPEFGEKINKRLFNLTPEEAFERVKYKRDEFIAHPYDCEYPFVLRHGDLHGRNVIVSFRGIVAGQQRKR